MSFVAIGTNIYSFVKVLGDTIHYHFIDIVLIISVLFVLIISVLFVLITSVLFVLIISVLFVLLMSVLFVLIISVLFAGKVCTSTSYVAKYYHRQYALY